MHFEFGARDVAVHYVAIAENTLKKLRAML